MFRKLLFLAIIIMASQAKAADHIVEEFGQAPAFATIADAVAAASDGDRIFIKNRGGLIPWIENITIDKSLELLAFENDSFFLVEGQYYIIPANGRTVSIIGMDNILGSVSAQGTGNTNNRTKVNIYSSKLRSGSISFDVDGYNLTTAGNLLSDGQILMRYGNAYGNNITIQTLYYSAISIAGENIGVFSTVNIIGNVTNSNSYGIYINSATTFFNIWNNFISVSGVGIQLYGIVNSFAQVNTIYNNTISLLVDGAAGISLGMYGHHPPGAVEIMNNLIDQVGSSGTGSYGIADNNYNLQSNVYYNVIDNAISSTNRVTGYITTQSNNTNSAITLNPNGTVQGTGGVNAGNPSPLYYDLDLTINDAGAYGGSYSLANYNQMLTGAARVYMVNVPPTVRTGNTLNVTAESYDR